VVKSEQTRRDQQLMVHGRECRWLSDDGAQQRRGKHTTKAILSTTSLPASMYVPV
jgi:hypothetical protein